MLFYTYIAAFLVCISSLQLNGNVKIHNPTYFDCNGAYKELNSFHQNESCELEILKEGAFEFLVIKSKDSETFFTVLLDNESFHWINDSTLNLPIKKAVFSNPCANLNSVGNHSIVFSNAEKKVKFYYNDKTDTFLGDSLVAAFDWK